MALTTEQKNFFNEAASMEFGKKLILNAPGGTGKTYLLKALVSHFMDEEKIVKVLTPTHKAANIFREEGIVAETIHRFLKASREIDEETGQIEFVFSISTSDNRADLIIVDEASMVGKKMYECIMAHPAPVIFVGDQHQIMPVKESISPVFADKKAMRTLTRNMRINRNPDSMSAMYLKKFREGVDNPSGKIRVERRSMDFMLEYFKDKGNDVVCLAWTNSQVSFLNKTIREHLFGQNPEPLYVDETLIFSGYRRVLLDNGELYNYYSSNYISVQYLRKVKKFIPFQVQHCPHQTKQSKKVSKCEICNVKGHNVSGYEIEFHEITDQNGVTWLKVIKGEKQLKEIISDFKSMCITKKKKELWREFYEFKEYHSPDLFYKYAMTVHKAQGSQFKIVFVDINNIRMNKEAPERVRLEYTAASRFTDFVFFI